MSFTISQNKKKPFQAIETRSSKIRKFDIFPMGLNHAFGPKIAFFRKLFFLPIQARKMSFTIFYNEKTFFQAIKCLLRYSTAKNRLSFLRLFQAIQARKMSFTVFQNKKKPLQAIKTRSSKSLKIDIFPKGLTHRFRPKMAIFPNSFFQAIQARKMCFTIFQNEKKPFQAFENKKFKKSKN